MDRDSFDRIFHARVVEPLTHEGFRSSGKSLVLEDGPICIALIRLGGRMAKPGAICHVLCFRHSWLRGVQDDVANATTPSDYVFKWLPSELQTRPATLWHYESQLNYPHEWFEYAALTDREVAEWSDVLSSFVRSVFVPWARSLSVDEVVAQLRSHGTDMWSERRWIEDYAARPQG